MHPYAQLYLAAGTSLVALCWAIAISGWVPGAGSSEVVPSTVRDNPASFRPTYGGWTGWHAPASGGGFGFGK